MISICIPTFNRANLLDNCLKSITSQFKDKTVARHFELIISDNNSPDGTGKIVNKYASKFKNIRYFKNNRNIGTKNTIKVATYSKADYIWFLADDDWLKPDSLRTILFKIKKDPDLMIVNLDLYSKDGNKVIDPNLLRTSADFFGEKRKFFSYLNDKFYLPIDWYLTTYSNTLLKRSIFLKNFKILDIFSGKRHLFPHKYFVFYSNENYKISVISKRLVNFRADNRSFGSQDKNEFLIDWYQTLRIYYNNIYKINRQYISQIFTIKLFIKQSLRSLRLYFLLLAGVDISDFLVKYFYRKQSS